MKAEIPLVSKDKQGSHGIAPSDPTKKKKKKKVVLQRGASGSMRNVNLEEDTNGHLRSEGEKGHETVLQLKCSWTGSDRDYGYEELLHRVYSMLNENNPDLAGDKRRTVMKPPQVVQEGTGRTLLVNFTDLCDIMHRPPDHVVAFMLAEIGTSGYLDRLQRLVFRGRFGSKNLEGTLRRYVDEYVLCSVCRSPDTILSKDRQLFILGCNMVHFLLLRTIWMCQFVQNADHGVEIRLVRQCEKNVVLSDHFLPLKLVMLLKQTVQVLGSDLKHYQ